MRYAIRSLRKSPALAAIAIASLALGIGANVTVYSVVREMIVDDVSARRLDQLVRVGADLTYTQYRDLRSAPAFDGMAFHSGFHDINWRNGERAEIAWAMDTSANFFDVLGINPTAGRLYSQRDEGHLVAVVTYAFWTRRLQSNPNAMGSALDLNGRLYTVLGVLPRDYRSVMGRGVSPEIYAPSRLESQPRCRAFGRLHEGVARAQARDSWTAAAERIGGREFARQASILRPFGGFAANALREDDGRYFFVFFVMLFGVAGFLVLIACSNVAGLLLARGVSRQRELAIRTALGANRWQLARPLIAEAVVLVGCGGIVALAIDAFLRSRLSYLRWPNAYNVPFEFHFQGDRGLLLYALLTAAVALVVSSLQPALRGSNPNPEIQRAARNARPTAFVALQVVLSMVLLTLGALFGRGFWRIARIDLGFDAAHTIIAAVHIPSGPHLGPHGRPWRDQLVRRARQVPGVLAVTSTNLLPLMGEVDVAPVRLAGSPVSAFRDVYAMEESEQYFTAMGIPVLRGRDFHIADRDRKPTPAIINRTLARQLFGDRDPVGSLLVRGREKEESLEIVGVVADSRMRTLGEPRKPALYTPDFVGRELLVRVVGDPQQWVEPLRSALAEVDREAALDIRPMRNAVAGAVFPMQVAAAFVGALSCLGLGLALVGLYGSVSYAVNRRTREMGIRAALGATRGGILRAVLRDGMAVVAGGVAVGLALAVAAIRPLVGLLPDGIDPWNPLMFAAVAALLLTTATLAALIPARRAANADPAMALREE